MSSVTVVRVVCVVLAAIVFVILVYRLKGRSK
jgi:hypothetical protein